MITEEWAARLALIFLALLFVWWFIRRRSSIKKWYLPTLDTTPDFYVYRTQAPRSSKRKRENKTENKCRQILEKIFNKPFPTIRPDFLTSPKTGKPLELDCYNAQLKLALEYNGAQHYTYTPHFHRTKFNFISQVHRDDWKRKKCKEMGIKLIEVPYWIVPQKLEPFIRKELKKLGV